MTELKTLEEKLKWLEEKEYHFYAGYLGSGECFLVRHKTGGFIDFHWMEGDTSQTFTPTEFIKAVDEAIEFIMDKEDLDGIGNTKL